jgi:trehalose 6-phosphate phosphatase
LLPVRRHLGSPILRIANRLDGLPFRHVFGNHGIEPALVSAAGTTLVGEWVRLVELRLEGWPGIEIEDKTHSLTVHYRHARDRSRARVAITSAVRELRGARPIGGTEAISLIPKSGANKGVALQYARQLCGCDKVIYVGDDTTDEDAFGSAPPDRLLGIRIGAHDRSRSSFRLYSQRDIDAFLLTLLNVRGVAG